MCLNLLKKYQYYAVSTFQAKVPEESFRSFLIEMETAVVKEQEQESFLRSHLIC